MLALLEYFWTEPWPTAGTTTPPTVAEMRIVRRSNQMGTVPPGMSMFAALKLLLSRLSAPLADEYSG